VGCQLPIQNRQSKIQNEWGVAHIVRGLDLEGVFLPNPAGEAPVQRLVIGQAGGGRHQMAPGGGQPGPVLHVMMKTFSLCESGQL